jgi:hypothetical protein
MLDLDDEVTVPGTAGKARKHRNIDIPPLNSNEVIRPSERNE